MSKNKSKNGKKGMSQNHSRSAKETKKEIKRLLEEGRTPRQICDKLQLGYSTVMKYRKQILITQEQSIEKIAKDEPNKTINKNTVSFRIRNHTFEVEVVERGKNILYSLDDIKKGIDELSTVDIDNCIRKTIDKGREFIHEGFLLPIANKVKDFYFTKSVKQVLFTPTVGENILTIIDLFDSLSEFITESSKKDWEDINALQEKLLISLDKATDIQELTSITSKLKRIRTIANDISKEDAFREYLSSLFDSKNLNVAEISKEAKGKFL